MTTQTLAPTGAVSNRLARRSTSGSAQIIDLGAVRRSRQMNSAGSPHRSPLRGTPEQELELLRRLQRVVFNLRQRAEGAMA